MNGTTSLPRLLLTASIAAVVAAGIFTTAHAQSAADGKAAESASAAAGDKGKSRRERRAEERAAEDAKRKASELTKATVPSPEATKTPTLAADDPDKPICRTQKITGSNFSRRSCATAAQWAAFDKHAEEDASEASRRRRGQAPVTE